MLEGDVSFAAAHFIAELPFFGAAVANRSLWTNPMGFEACARGWWRRRGVAGSRAFRSQRRELGVEGGGGGGGGGEGSAAENGGSGGDDDDDDWLEIGDDEWERLIEASEGEQHLKQQSVNAPPPLGTSQPPTPRTEL